jgi:thioredoxin-dependent peroxiredoxin
MTVKRVGDVTMDGRPFTVIGERLSVGDEAPDFRIQRSSDFRHVSNADYAGRIRLISTVPSLDTAICDAQTRRFNQVATELGENVTVLTVSADLPVTQRRWCGAAGVDRVDVLTDHFDMNFGEAYGTYVEELRIEQRAVFVVDADNKVRYAEYVPEIGQHPDYEAAITAVKNLIP